MIDKELERLVGEKLSVAFEERDITLGHDYVSTTSDYNKRGVLQSSMAARAVTNLHTRELVISASVAIDGMKTLTCYLTGRASASKACSRLPTNSAMKA